MSAEEQTTRPDKGAKRPSRHAKIMRGVVTPIFGLLAVAAVVLGYMNATMWKPSTEITVSATMSGSRYVVTDPNVLTLLDQNATITVDSGSSQDEACVALGSSKDVAGWVASEKSYTRITGLASWSELSTQKGSSTSQGAPTSADDAVSFKDSDMWTAVKCGTGSVSLKSKKTGASTVAIVDLGENVTNAKVQLHWVRSEVPDFAMPFYLSGGLLAVLAVLCASVFAMPPHKRRNKRAFAMVEGVGVNEGDENEVSAWVKNAETAASNRARSRSRHGRRRHAEHNRRRHATHRRSGRASSQSSQSEATETPVIIDPSSRNLVADQQNTIAESQPTVSESTVFESTAGESSVDDEATSVISQDELAAYFARLAQEEVQTETQEDGQEEDQ